MTVLLLARHGETDWNREGRWQGHAPTPLNETGRAQARALARRLAAERLDVVYSSDLRRALETAQIVASALGLEIRTEPGLRELDVGSRQGLTSAELDGVAWDGETYDAHRERVLAAVHRIVAGHPNARVLAVTHGGCLRRMQEVVLGRPLDILDNCAVWRIVLRGGFFTPLD